MTRFNDLLNDLDKLPLSGSLPRILRVAQEIGDAGLERWVRLELSGYLDSNDAMSDDVEVPEYRTVVGQWKDDRGNVFVIPDQTFAFLNEIRLRQAVIELEAFQQVEGGIIVRYEDLTAAPLIVLNRLWASLGAEKMDDSMSWDDMQVHEVRSAVRNMNQRSIRNLDSRDMAAIRSVASVELDRYGYREG